MKKLLVIVGIILLFSNSDLFAGEEGRTVELEPIVVTPWRLEESLSDINRNVTVITEEDIKNSSAQYLPELIQSRTGVVVTDYLGNPKGTLVDIRGFGESSTSNVLVLVNGRRTNQVDLSGPDWGQIDLNAIERVEIVRGPSTVLYGDNATGGVVNIITKKGTTEKPQFKISGELGSYQYHKEYLNISGVSQKAMEALTGKDQSTLKYIKYFLSYSNQDTTGYRANNDYWASDYFGSLILRPGDQFELGLSAGYHRDHYGMPGALYLDGNPWATTPLGVNQIGRRGTVFSDDRGFTSDYFVAVEPKLIFLFGGNQITGSLLSSARERRSKGLNVPEPNSWAGRQELETTHHITTYELRPKLETSLIWKGIDNRFVIGADFFHAKDDVLSGDRLNSQQDETDINKETLGVFIHDNIKISDMFLLNAGGRIEWADYTFNQKRLIVNHNTKKIKEGAFSFGLGYKYNKKSQIYGEVSRSFRFPNTEEYYNNKTVNSWTGAIRGGLNTDLKHQRAINYEVGLKELSFDWLNINADVFLMDVRSEIYLEPSTYVNSNYSPKTRHYGLELEGRLKLLKGMLHPFVNWTLQKSYFKGGLFDDNLVPLVPENKLATGVTVSPMKGLNWTTALNYVGSRYMVSDQRNLAPKLKHYMTVDTKLNYTYKYVSIWGAVKNVLDKKYYVYGVTNSAGSAQTFYPAPERSFEAGLTLTF